MYMYVYIVYSLDNGHLSVVGINGCFLHLEQLKVLKNYF